jgi:hypothetical protein
LRGQEARFLANASVAFFLNNYQWLPGRPAVGSAMAIVRVRDYAALEAARVTVWQFLEAPSPHKH